MSTDPATTPEVAPKTDAEKALQRRIDDEIVKAQTPAIVTLYVRRFKDVLTTPDFAGARGTDHDMDVDPTHNRVHIPTTKPKTLLVRRGAIIRFKVVDVEHGGTQVYRPIGIAFVQQPPIVDADRVGEISFDRGHIRIADDYLEIADSFGSLDRATDSKHKFSVIIQSDGDGKIGIIDPSIENDQI